MILSKNQFDKHSTEAATRMLRFFASASNLSFDRPLATRTVTELVRAIPGDDYRVWGQRVVEAGESLNLRIRSTDLNFKDLTRMVRERVPVAACFALDNSDEPGRWLALSEYKRGKFHVLDLAGEEGEWISARRLRKMLREYRDSHELRWITGQPAMPCDITLQSPVGQNANRPVKPFERLIGIIKADRPDLWAVTVFSVIVGILALATPIAVEALVNTVAFGRYLQPIVVLSLILMTFLGFAAAIRALNTWIVEIVQRRMFVRVVEDLAYRLPRVEQHSLDGKYGPELANRFFDVVTLQKIAAKLLLDGITIVLQTVLGMAVLAFYHPFLLGFDVVLMICILFIVFVLGRGAVKTAIRESASKYRVAAWMEELLRNPTAFKMHGGSQFGLDRADSLAVEYLQARRAHFRIVMRQIIFSLTLQAVSGNRTPGLGWMVGDPGRADVGSVGGRRVNRDEYRGVLRQNRKIR